MRLSSGKRAVWVEKMSPFLRQLTGHGLSSLVPGDSEREVVGELGHKDPVLMC